MCGQACYLFNLISCCPKHSVPATLLHQPPLQAMCLGAFAHEISLRREIVSLFFPNSRSWPHQKKHHGGFQPVGLFLTKSFLSQTGIYYDASWYACTWIRWHCFRSVNTLFYKMFELLRWSSKNSWKFFLICFPLSLKDILHCLTCNGYPPLDFFDCFPRKSVEFSTFTSQLTTRCVDEPYQERGHAKNENSQYTLSD